jgi:hypothetical protein
MVQKILILQDIHTCSNFSEKQKKRRRFLTNHHVAERMTRGARDAEDSGGVDEADGSGPAVSTDLTKKKNGLFDRGWIRTRTCWMGTKAQTTELLEQIRIQHEAVSLIPLQVQLHLTELKLGGARFRLTERRTEIMAGRMPASWTAW